MLKKLFLKEFFLAFYLVSGEIKLIYPLLGIDSLPDITLLSAMLLSLFMLSDMPDKLKKIPIKHFEFISIFILIYLFIIFSLGYSSSSSYALVKTVNFGTVVLAFIFPLLTKKINIEIFIYFLTLLIFSISIIFLNFYISYLNKDGVILLSMSREDALKLTVGYLSVAILNGLLVLYYFFKKNQNIFIQWFIFLTAFIFLFASGGRGPLLVVLLILGTYFIYQMILSFMSFKINKLTIPILVFVIAIGGLYVAISTNSIETNSRVYKLFDSSIERFKTLKDSKGGGKSAYSRVLYTKFSIDKINEIPLLGYGIGSFGLEYNGIDEKDYPHNIFLEVWFELGIVPLFLILLLFYGVYMHIYSIKCYWCIAVYFYFFLNVLKSDSLIDIRLLGSFLGFFLLIKSQSSFQKLGQRDNSACYY